MPDNFTLLTPAEYVRDMTEAIDKAERRVLMIALVISEDKSTRELMAAIKRAAKRGVTVSLGTDIYFTFRELETDASRWRYLRSQATHMKNMRKDLTKSGASVRWLGQFGMTLFSRRTHIKWTIVDDTVYSFGGVNLYEMGLANNDFILRRADPHLAERLAAEHYRVIATDKAGVGYNSHVIELEAGRIMIDGGKIGDSIIYKRALELAREAKSITYVSQYCPTGTLGRVLKRKPNSKLYFNSWRQASDPFNRLLIRWSMFTHGMQTKYERVEYLHAKFMIFEMPDERTIAITGSHNFVAAGGWLGTREVALETEDKKVIRQLRDFLENHVV